MRSSRGQAADKLLLIVAGTKNTDRERAILAQFLHLYPGPALRIVSHDDKPDAVIEVVWREQR